MEIDYAFLKKNFRFTFTFRREKIKPYLMPRVRQSISAKRLIEIVGEKRAHQYFERAYKMKEDSLRIKVQDKGTLDIYVH